MRIQCNLHVMGKDTAVGSVLSVSGQGLIPFKGWRGVVGSVDVVMVQTRLLEVGKGNFTADDGGNSGLGLLNNGLGDSGLGSRGGGLRLRGLDNSGDDGDGVGLLGSLLLVLGGNGSRVLEEDGTGGLLAGGDGNSDDFVVPDGLIGALVDGASSSEESAGAEDNE